MAGKNTATTHIGNDPEAVNRRIREHLRHRPNDGEAWLALGQALADGPMNAELGHAIEQAIAAMPEDLRVWKLAAAIHLRHRGPSAARRWLQATAGQNRQLAAPLLALAELAADSDPAEAAAHYRQIARTFPNDPRPLAMLASLHLARGELLEAERHASGALERDADAIEGLSVRADAYRLSAEWGLALDDYRRLERLAGHSAPLANHIGACLAGLERYDEAAKCFDEALALDPNHAAGHLNQALLLAARNRPDDAIARFRQVMDSPDAAPDVKSAASQVLDVLLENRRLAPHIAAALDAGDAQPLVEPLCAAPNVLLVEDSESHHRLDRLAQCCESLVVDVEAMHCSAEDPRLAFLEACMHGKIDGDSESLAGLYDSGLPGPDGDEQIADYRSAIEMRRPMSADLLGGPGGEAGEAWLRFWHARLMRLTPDKSPGQFKWLTNTIGDRTLTPPAAAVTAVRHMNTLRQSLPPGAPRGLFMKIAICMVHPFADGNGRLSRFVMAWDFISAGRPPLLIPTSVREAAAKGMDAIWFDGDASPLLEAARQGVEETTRLLAVLD